MNPLQKALVDAGLVTEQQVKRATQRKAEARQIRIAIDGLLRLRRPSPRDLETIKNLREALRRVEEPEEP